MADKKSRTNAYDAETHKRAYETYRVSRNLSDVQRTLGLTYETVLRWEKSNFVCIHGCPFHGWSELLEQELQVMAAKEKAIASGITDPIEQQKVMEAALANRAAFQAPAPTEKEIKRAIKLVITDEQMLNHWRHLYAKVYYDLSGVVIDFQTLVEDISGTNKLFSEELLKRGLRLTSAENGVRVLGYISDKIKELERRIMGGDVITTSSVPVTQQQEKLLDDASPDTLRKLLQAVEKLPPPAIKRVADVLGDEDEEAASRRGLLN